MSSVDSSTKDTSSGAGTLSGHEGWGGMAMGAPAVEQSDSRESEGAERSRRMGSKVRAKSHEQKRVESARWRGLSQPLRDPALRSIPTLIARGAPSPMPINTASGPQEYAPSPDAERMLAMFLSGAKMAPLAASAAEAYVPAEYGARELPDSALEQLRDIWKGLEAYAP